jgi:hypothetical protein
MDISVNFNKFIYFVTLQAFILLYYVPNGDIKCVLFFNSLQLFAVFNRLHLSAGAKTARATVDRFVAEYAQNVARLKTGFEVN